MSTKKLHIATFDELFPDYEALIKKWNGDFAKMKNDIENAIYNLTHLTVDVEIDESLALRRTEIDLISGDVTIILPKKPESEEEMGKIHSEGLKLAQDNLDKRLDLLVKIIKVVCDAISPTGPLTNFVKNLADTVKPSQ